MQWDWKVLVGAVVAAVAAGWFFTRTVHEPDVDFEAIDRDLGDLVSALRADDVANVELIPRFSAGIHFPGTFQYRRPSEFWRPAISGGPRIGRPGRRRR